MAIDPSIPLGYKANSGDFGDMVRMADMLNQYRYNASARPIQIQQQRMEVEKQKQEQLEQEVLKREYSKYLDGNGDGDREGYIRAISPHVRLQTLNELRKEFMILDARKAEAKKAEQEAAESQKQLEGMRSAARELSKLMQPSQRTISSIPVDQVTKEQAMEAATGTGNVTIPGKSFKEAVTQSPIAEQAFTNPVIAKGIDVLGKLYDDDADKRLAAQIEQDKAKQERLYEKMKADADYRDAVLENQRMRLELERERGDKKLDKQDRYLKIIDDVVRKDKQIASNIDKLNYVGTTMGLLESDNPIAQEGAKTQIARLSGEVGVLTDRDVARFGGSKSVMSRVNQAIKQSARGTLTEENKKYLYEIVDVMKKRLSENVNKRLEVLRSAQTGVWPDADKNRINSLIDAYKVENDISSSKFTKSENDVMDRMFPRKK